MRGFLFACLCFLLVALPAFAAPVPGTYDGMVRHNFDYHNITTTINADGHGTYTIDDGTVGKLTYVGERKGGDLYQWKDRYGEGVALFQFQQTPFHDTFGGFWSYRNTADYQRHLWQGNRWKPSELARDLK